MTTGRDPDGTFDIPKFEGTVFEGGNKKNTAGGSQDDGFFVN
jgi:xylulose-5-phosphate/fructose-6-phosphate phosphoketolase